MFLAYIRYRRTPLLLFLLFAAIMPTSFALYHLPMQAALYPLLLCAAIGTCAAIRDYLKYRAHIHSLRDALRFRAPSETLPIPNDCAEELWKEICLSFIDENTRQSDEMRRRADDMSEYYALWAHQIKIPISVMRLNLQNEDTPLSRSIMREVGRVEQYAEMALTFARLDARTNDLVFRTCNIDDILRQAVRRFSCEFIYKKLKLEYTPTDISAVTDEKWLLFIVEQILSNAVKYTKAGTVSVSVSEKNVICIKDTGMGIAPEDLPRVFERGYTGVNGRMDKRASGIGLYLCRRAADLLGIQITIESKLDEGTSVYIDLGEKTKA